jgi:hypothetical protein
MADEEGDGPGRLSWSLVAVLRRWSSPLCEDGLRVFLASLAVGLRWD